MHDDEQVIRRAWRSLVRASATDSGFIAPTSSADAPAHEDLLDAVLSRHREPHRHYHTVTHVAWVVRIVDELHAVVPVPSLPIVHAAAIYHDVIYDPRASDNEALSARLAAGACRELGWSDGAVAEVERLILATAGHEAGPDDAAAAVLLDADLSVLGAEPAVYDAYATGVRLEYAHVDDAGWRVGRAVVLRHFLDRSHVYATEAMRSTRERRARANLSAELVGLERA